MQPSPYVGVKRGNRWNDTTCEAVASLGVATFVGNVKVVVFDHGQLGQFVLFHVQEEFVQPQPGIVGQYEEVWVVDKKMEFQIGV